MLKNYLKVTVRNLIKNKAYSLINIVGLAVGIACSLLILFYVYDELNFDHQYKNSDRIYRVTASYTSTGKEWACIGPPVGPALQNSIPGIERVVRIRSLEGNKPVFSYAEKQFEEQNVLYADSTILQVFTLPLVKGNPATALRESNSLVLTKEMARKYFGDKDPMGKTLIVDGNWSLTVTGVLRDVSPRTHIPFGFLISMSTFYSQAGDWVDEAKTWAGFYTYVLLRPSSTAGQVEQKLSSFVADFYADQFEKPASDELTLNLQPLKDIHMYSSLEKELSPNNDIAYIYIFSSIAFFILLIACINFINLSTAQFTKRLQEVGIRKVLGAQRAQLAKQFFGETFIMTLFGLLLALLLIEISAPFFQNLSGKNFVWSEFNLKILIIGICSVVLFTSFISGSYPALYIARFNPIRTLHGLSLRTAHAVALRKVLVFFQFVISIFLIIGSMIIHNQLELFRNKQLGFDKEMVVCVQLRGEMQPAITKNLEAFKQTLRQHTSILNVGAGSEAPGERFSLETIQREERKNEPGTQMRILWGVDQDYIPTLGIKLVQGRNFSNTFASDSMSFILNETAVHELNLSEPLGTLLRWDDYVGHVVGVVKNFNFASLHYKIESLIIPHRPYQTDLLFVRVSPGQINDALSAIHTELDRIIPNQLFQYSFLSEDFNQLYSGEDKLGEVFDYFTGIALLIACLGLFGLATFAAERRTKESGIRKVLGASSPSIVNLISKDFIKLVLISNFLAWPLAWYTMNKWLQNFAYRIDIDWWIFVLAGGSTLLIALLTVSIQAIRTAAVNPVRSLRYE